ncbi:MAG: CZB domain-containing protein [Gammaproteobacteria bacterium]|nr:CZB domain-containing protein [Gammaproteobacteria bacterium]
MQRAYRAIDLGPDSAEASTVMVNEQNCRFGKWLADEKGGMKYSHLPAYNAIGSPHSQVHSNVHQSINILSLNWQQDTNLQNKIVAHMQEAENGSHNLICILDGMVAEKKQMATTS